MVDFLIIAIVFIVLAVAIVHIIKEKKKGTRCIGCPAAGTCSQNHGEGGCSCHTDTKK